MNGLEKRVFLICPVNELTDTEDLFLKGYVTQLEAQGYRVHYPPRDTNQVDSIGLRICTDNRAAIRDADAVHIYWKAKSKGSKFDFGMAFQLEKPIKLVNKDDVERTPHKSFENMLLELDEKYHL